TIIAPSTAQLSAVVVNANFSNVTIDDLTIIPQAQQRGGITSNALLTLRNVAIQGGQLALTCNGGLMVTNVTLTNTGGVTVSGQLKADRLSLISANMTTGFFIAGGTVVDVTNLVIAGARSQCLTISDLATGTITNATIADCGTAITGGPSAIKCGSAASVSFRSSIAWTPGSTLPPLSGCNFSQTMLGPTPVTGASSADPLFVNYAMHDFRLESASPAVDAAAAGPSIDVLGTTRPQGSRYDLGAYEYKP
ncbi:MAG TPA: choice-of-anchor Q domain-containing protein, partial [Kofleriaceae bacterium]